MKLKKISLSAKQCFILGDIKKIKIEFLICDLLVLRYVCDVYELNCFSILSLRLIPRKMVIRNASEEEVSDISFDDNDSLILKASSKHFKGYAMF